MAAYKLEDFSLTIPPLNSEPTSDGEARRLADLGEKKLAPKETEKKKGQTLLRYAQVPTVPVPCPELSIKILFYFTLKNNQTSVYFSN
jgi:hypothetical protein